MFIDADIHFDPKSVVHLLKSGHDISVACYPKKFVDWEQARKGVQSGENKPMSMMSSNLVVNFGAKTLSVENDFIQVLDGPTGFMLIKREVFKKMEEH